MGKIWGGVKRSTIQSKSIIHIGKKKKRKYKNIQEKNEIWETTTQKKKETSTRKRHGRNKSFNVQINQNMSGVWSRWHSSGTLTLRVIYLVAAMNLPYSHIFFEYIVSIHFHFKTRTRAIWMLPWLHLKTHCLICYYVGIGSLRYIHACCYGYTVSEVLM